MKVTLACSAADRLRGLFGRHGFEDVLLLTPCNDVHTFGMRRPIDVAFIQTDGMVVESHRSVGSRRRIRCRQAAATLERFATEEPWFDCGDCVELKRYARDSKEREETR